MCNTTSEPRGFLTYPHHGRHVWEEAQSSLWGQVRSTERACAYCQHCLFWGLSMEQAILTTPGGTHRHHSHHRKKWKHRRWLITMVTYTLPFWRPGICSQGAAGPCLLWGLQGGSSLSLQLLVVGSILEAPWLVHVCHFGLCFRCHVALSSVCLFPGACFSYGHQVYFRILESWTFLIIWYYFPFNIYIYWFN